MVKKNLTENEKIEKLYNLYIFAYDKFNKFASKKDNNMQLIKEMNSSLKTNPQILIIISRAIWKMFY